MSFKTIQHSRTSSNRKLYKELNVIIFVNGSSSSLKALAETLKHYQAGSGQRINYNKSFFITSKHCPARRATTMSQILGMQRSSLPFRYLGVNLFRGRNRLYYHQRLLEKVDEKLTGWQRKLLSPGGRLTLIKHVLSSIPLYTMASFALPRQIMKALESKFASFLWGTSEGRPKRHWASWSKICMPQEEGGLGVRCLSTIHLVYSAKLYFNFKRGGSLWSTFMQARYTQNSSRASDSLTWKRMQEVTDFVEEHTAQSNGELIWMPSSYGNFSFSSAYDCLRPRVGSTLSAECIWGGGIPSKVSVFMWKLLKRLLPFPDVIQRLGFCMPSICPFCRCASANLEHCLLLCSQVLEVWIYFGGAFGLSLHNATSVRSACHSWWLISSSSNTVGCFARIIPSIVLWYLWIAYNEAIYEDSNFSAIYTIKRIKRESVMFSLSRPFRRRNDSDSFLLSEGLIAKFAETPRRKIIRVLWLAPPSGRLKLNTDAMLSPNGAAGGACLRDSSGRIIAGLCFPLSASSALEAEALALRFAIQWCELTMLFPALVEVDSLSLVNFISSSTTRIPWKIKEAVLHIRSCLTSWNSSLSHIYREANQVADALATEGLCSSSSSIFCSFSSLPVHVKLPLLSNLRGFAFTWLI